MTLLLSYAEYQSRWRDHLAQKTDTLYTAWVTLPIARQVSYLLYRIGLHPNTVSLLSLAAAIIGIGAILWAPDRLWAQVAAVVWLQVSYVLDYSDGPVARASGRASPFGAYLDLLLDRCNSMLVFFGVFAADVLRSGAVLDFSTIALLLCSFAGYFLFLLAVIVRKFVYPHERVLLRPWRSGRQRLARHALTLPLDLLDTGVHYLLVTLAFAFGCVLPVLVAYGALGWLSLAALSVFLYLRRQRVTAGANDH